MIEIKKRLLLVSLLGTVLLFSGIAFASEKNKSTETDLNKNEVIKLVNFEVPTPFSSDTIKIAHEELENGSKVVVTDKNSNQVLAVYSETITDESVQKNDKYWRSHLEVSFRKNPVTILVYTDLIVSKKEGQSPQIESVPYIYQTEGNIAGFNLKSPHASVRNANSFPDDTVILNITGQIYTSSEMNKDTGLSYKDFKESTFEMNGSARKEWFARKSYNSQITFNLIQDN